MSILKIKTREGYTMKVLSELLQGYLKDSCFIVDEKGIRLVGVDKLLSTGTVLIDLDLKSTSFAPFTLNHPDKRLSLGMNLMFLHKTLKPIRKKDYLTLLLDSTRPTELGVKIGQGDITGNTMSHLVITNINPVEVDIPQGYRDPIKTTSKEFQKIKTLNKMSKQVKVTSDGTTISFYAGTENLWSRQITLGEVDDTDSSPQEQKNVYSQTFEMKKIVQLIKMAGLSNIVQIYIGQNLPLKFELNVGTLGKICVYLKSMERIEAEKREEEDSQPYLNK